MQGVSVSKPYDQVKQGVSKKEPRSLPELIAQYNREFLLSFRQVRAAFKSLAKDIDDGAFTLGDVMVREVSGAPIQDDPNGSVAFSDTGVYVRLAGIWVPLMTSGSVTAGAGLVDSGTPAAPIIDAVALDATLVVEPDGMKVGLIGDDNNDGTLIAESEFETEIRRLRQSAQGVEMLLRQLIRLELGQPLDYTDGL